MMNLPKTSKIDKKSTRFIISPDGAACDAMQCGRDPVAPTLVARRYGPADQNSRLGRAGDGRIQGPPSLGFAKVGVSRIVSGLRAGNYRPCSQARKTFRETGLLRNSFARRPCRSPLRPPARARAGRKGRGLMARAYNAPAACPAIVPPRVKPRAARAPSG